MLHFLSHNPRGPSRAAAVWQRGRHHVAAKQGGIREDLGSSRRADFALSPPRGFLLWGSTDLHTITLSSGLRTCEWIRVLFSLMLFINQASLRQLQYIFLYLQANLPASLQTKSLAPRITPGSFSNLIT